MLEPACRLPHIWTFPVQPDWVDLDPVELGGLRQPHRPRHGK